MSGDAVAREPARLAAARFSAAPDALLVQRAATEPRVVRNSRQAIDWNTCGQAAAATVLIARAVAPYLTLNDGDAIDRLRASHPPDVPFGLGTSAFRMLAALRAHGLDARLLHSGVGGLGLPPVLSAVRAALLAGDPVPVCVDEGLLGERRWGAHWAILLGVDEQGAWLGNAGRSEPLAWPMFMRAWRCRHLPYGHNHAALLIR